MSDDFGREVRELLAYAEDFDKDNREQAFIDLDFEGFKQWDDRVRRYREGYIDANGNEQPLPCFTINTAQQYTGQVVGDWLTNETSITVLPREDGDVKVAQVRSELMRSIELQSKAARVYSSSLAQMVACGISNFRVDVENAYEDAFERDIFIRDIPDPLAVRWDPLANDPTGRDATFCFVAEGVRTEEYERRFPKAALPSLIEKECGAPWADGNIVMLPEYWKIEERPAIFGMTAEGKTVNLTKVPRNKWPPLAINSATGQPIVNEKAKCKYAVMVMTNGVEPLTDPFELKLPRLPIIRVNGRETRTRDGRVRFGIIRALRDSQRYKNYIRSVRAEMLMRAPRANFIAPVAAVEGREADWENTLRYDGNIAPTEITARNLGALLNEEQMFAQDMKDVTGIHEASLGMPSNETSGRAILARQHEGDVATVFYRHSITNSQQEAGEVVNELIPTVFDTARTIRTVGADMAVKMVRVNDPNDPESIDIGIGRYDVISSTGPAYQTRRQQASDFMLQLINAQPALAGIIGDLAMKAQDAPEADKMAERIKRTIDPKILGDDADDGKSEEEIAQQKAKAQEAEQIQQIGMKLEMDAKQAATRESVAKAAEAEARARKANAEADAAERGIKDQIAGYNAETQRIRAITAKDFPLPPEAVAILAPVVTQAVMNALASPDVLPLELHHEIAASSLARSDQADALAAQQPPEQDVAA